MSWPLATVSGEMSFRPLARRWRWHGRTTQAPWWKRLGLWFRDLALVVWRADSWAPAWGIDWPPVIVWTCEDDYYAKRDEILEAIRRYKREPMIIVPEGVRVDVLSVVPPLLRIWF